VNKALEWLKNKRAQGYVPKFKAGDIIFAKNGEFTLMAKIEEVERIEGQPIIAPNQGSYKLKYMINNQGSNLNYPRMKDIKSIDAKYNICPNPEMFLVLYGKG